MNNPYIGLIIGELIVIGIIIVCAIISKRKEQKNIDKVINFIQDIRNKKGSIKDE